MSSINHMVTFTLYAGKDTPEAEAFLKESADALANIPGVEQFQVLRQVSEKMNLTIAFQWSSPTRLHMIHIMIIRFTANM